MFQKNSIMSLKKKSKSLGHLTALGSPGPTRQQRQLANKDLIMAQQSGAATSSPQNTVSSSSSYNYAAKTPLQRHRDYANQHGHLPPTRSTTALNFDTAPVNSNKTSAQKKFKGLVRQKTTNSMAMGRALWQKASIKGHSVDRKMNGESPSNHHSDFYGGFGQNGGPNHGHGGSAGANGGSSLAGGGGIIPNRQRVFIMDCQVKYTVGLQSQERNLFLFNDLILIAKERSSSHFKLKDQVPLSDVWLSPSTSISEVSEITLDPSTSFVIGWPITNAVITFGSPQVKSQWWDKLEELISKERSLAYSSSSNNQGQLISSGQQTPSQQNQGQQTAGGPTSLVAAASNIQVTYFDPTSNFEHIKTVFVGCDDSAKTCVSRALKALSLQSNSDSESSDQNKTSSDYQLWVRTRADEAPYPLIGHELPAIIKLSWTRQQLQISNQNSNEDAAKKFGSRCTFILRKVGQKRPQENDTNNNTPTTASTEGQGKTKLKKVKSSIKLQNVFRRVSQGGKNAVAAATASPSLDSPDSKNSSKKLGKLFGRKLVEVCEDGNRLPEAVRSMLVHVLKEGPKTVGIFRRSPNARAMRELREKLDSGEKVDFSDCSVFVTAALLKDFLRSLPDCLLMCQHYNSWIQLALDFADSQKNVDAIKSFVSTLPRMNGVLLQHVAFMLHKIASNHEENMMTASNLAICVGPSVLWSSDVAIAMDQSASKNSSNVAQILIEEYEKIYERSKIPILFNNESSSDSRKTSTASTSDDSKDSKDGSTKAKESSPKMLYNKSQLQTNPHHPLIQRAGTKKLYDNSSLDSLLDMASAQHFHETNGLLSSTSSSGGGISLTNLSHDSGLTTSDSQLYAFEDANSSSADEFSQGHKRAVRKVSANGQQQPANSQQQQPKRHYQHPVREAAMTASGGAAAASAMTPDINRSRDPAAYYNTRSASAPRSVPPQETQQPPQTPQRDPGHRDRIYKRMQRMAQQRNNLVSRYQRDGDADQAFMLDTTNFTIRAEDDEDEVEDEDETSGGDRSDSPKTDNETKRSKVKPARKGRAPAPPANSSIVRSNSVHQVRGVSKDDSVSASKTSDSSHRRTPNEWLRSRSTTRLNHNERSSSNSTLSDEDATPLVSRSNSSAYHKSRASLAATPTSTMNQNEIFSARMDGSYDIYLHDNHLLVNGEAFSTLRGGQQPTLPHQIQQVIQQPKMSPTVAHSVTPTILTPFMANGGSGSGVIIIDTPPGYEETISRQRLLRGNYNRSNSFVITTPQSSSGGGNQVQVTTNNKVTTSSGISPMTPLLAKKRLSENHLSYAGAGGRHHSPQSRLNFEVNNHHLNRSPVHHNSIIVPPPLPPKTDRPPLPPKQRISRINFDGVVDDETYVNSADLYNNQQQMYPPFSDGLVYPNFTPAARIHIGSEATSSKPNAPNLPPKEATPSSTPVKANKAKRAALSRMSAASTQTTVMRNAETQTDETDFYLYYGEDEELEDGERYEEDEEEDEDRSSNVANYDEDDWERYAKGQQQRSYQQQTPLVEAYNSRVVVDGSSANGNTPERSLSPEIYPSFASAGTGTTMMPRIGVGSVATGTAGPNRRSLLHQGHPNSLEPNSHQRATPTREHRKLEYVRSVPLNQPQMPQPGQPGQQKGELRGNRHVDPLITGEINWSVSQLRSLFNKRGHGANREDVIPSPSMSSTSSSSNHRQQIVVEAFNQNNNQRQQQLRNYEDVLTKSQPMRQQPPRPHSSHAQMYQHAQARYQGSAVDDIDEGDVSGVRSAGHVDDSDQESYV